MKRPIAGLNALPAIISDGPRRSEGQMAISTEWDIHAGDGTFLHFLVNVCGLETIDCTGVDVFHIQRVVEL